jgi:hypothetical protein
VDSSHQEFAGVSQLFHTIQLHQNTTGGNRRQKEKSDFIGCVTRMLAEYPPVSDLLLVLEDDALIVEDFFTILSSILEFHLHSYMLDEWLDIKLYTPPKWSGFGLDFLPLLDLIASSGLIAMLYIFSAKLISRQVIYLKESNLLLIFTSGFLLLAIPGLLFSSPDRCSAGC